MRMLCASETMKLNKSRVDWMPSHVKILKEPKEVSALLETKVNFVHRLSEYL